MCGRALVPLSENCGTSPSMDRALPTGASVITSSEALAADGGQALEGDVVRHTDGLANQRLERPAELESDPARW